MANNVSILKHFQVHLPFMFLFFPLLFSKVVFESVSHDLGLGEKAMCFD